MKTKEQILRNIKLYFITAKTVRKKCSNEVVSDKKFARKIANNILEHIYYNCTDSPYNHYTTHVIAKYSDEVSRRLEKKGFKCTVNNITGKSPTLLISWDDVK